MSASRSELQIILVVLEMYLSFRKTCIETAALETRPLAYALSEDSFVPGFIMTQITSEDLTQNVTYGLNMEMY